MSTVSHLIISMEMAGWERTR